MPVKNTSHAVYIYIYCVFSLIRWMYWTDVRSKRPKIESAWMDGTSRRALVTTRLGNPTGLTIDYSMGNRIYWCDSKENLIESMAWDGSDRVVVVNSGRFWSSVHLHHKLSHNENLVVVVNSIRFWSCIYFNHKLSHKENLIESMAWDGSDRMVVVNSGRFWSWNFVFRYFFCHIAEM